VPARGGDNSTARRANREAVRNLWRMNLLVLPIKGIVCGTVCRGRHATNEDADAEAPAVVVSAA
jgi:hypothetical protein